MKIKIDLEDYIEMLEDRKREVANNFGWTIPDGVWDYFLKALEEQGLEGDTNTRTVVDNLAVNGSFGPVENYDLLDKMVQYVIEKAASEGDTIDADNAKEYLANLAFEELRSIAEELDEDDDIAFFYEEPDGEYGLGICHFLFVI